MSFFDSHRMASAPMLYVAFHPCGVAMARPLLTRTREVHVLPFADRERIRCRSLCARFDDVSVLEPARADGYLGYSCAPHVEIGEEFRLSALLGMEGFVSTCMPSKGVG